MSESWQSKKPIPLRQRFATGTAGKIFSDYFYINFPKNYPWARQARVDAETLPDTLSLNDLKVGKTQLTVFITAPLEEKDTYRANASWGDEQYNPWLQDPPKKGQRRLGRAIRYLPNNRGVFIELKDKTNGKEGIDSLLRINEVPGSSGDIRDCIDIGDELVVEILEVRTGILELACSVHKALRGLYVEAQGKRLQQAAEPMIRFISNEDWIEEKPLQNCSIGLYLSDQFFTRHLALWLNNLGAHTQPFRDQGHLVRALKAVNRPDSLILDPQNWPITHPQTQSLIQAIEPSSINCLWLRSDNSPAPKANSHQASLPITLSELLRQLNSPLKTINKTQKKYRPPEFRDYQTQRVVDLAEKHMKNWCEEHQMHGALWVSQERKGWFIARASYGLDKTQLSTIQTSLGQSIFDSTMLTGETEISSLLQAGILNVIAPAMSDHVICLPIPFDYNGDGKETITRAIAFFYRQDEQQPNIKTLLKKHMPEMRLLIEMRLFGQANETFSALADIGQKSGAYLHEIGQSADTMDRLLKKQKENTTLNSREWRELQDHFKKLYKLAKGDLKAIQGYKGGSINIRDRLKRICDLYSFAFNDAQCNFTAYLPESSLRIASSALVVDHIICNLFDNAIHFCKQLPAGMAEISLKAEIYLKQYPAKLNIIITDNGPGVRAGMQDLIFQPRYSDKGQQGSGMGLFISRGMAENMGGTLELLKSIRWKETQFCLSIPISLDIRRKDGSF